MRKIFGEFVLLNCLEFLQIVHNDDIPRFLKKSLDF